MRSSYRAYLRTISHRTVGCFNGRIRHRWALMTRKEFRNHERRCPGPHMVEGLGWFR